MSIGKNIKKLREAKGLTQNELGNIIGLTYNSISQWENDRSVPRMQALEKLADALGVSKSEIVDGTKLSAPIRAKASVFTHDVPLPIYTAYPDGSVIQAPDDAMACIPEGAFVYVAKIEKLLNGSIVATKINGSITFRRLKIYDELYLLLPEPQTEKYKRIIIERDKPSDIEIIGQAIWADIWLEGR